MYKIRINEREFDLSLNDSLEGGQVDAQDFSLDLLESSEGHYHIIRDDKTYQVEVISMDRIQKKAVIKVNGHPIEVVLEDENDALLTSLGIEKGSSKKLKELKAPMPGLVLEVEVKVGDTVAEKDSLLILEAMKMENVIKSPVDGIIKSIQVVAGKTVEKNEILLEFE